MNPEQCMLFNNINTMVYRMEGALVKKNYYISGYKMLGYSLNSN